MTTCEAIYETLDLWQGIPREQLPEWLLAPCNEEELDHSFALYGATIGVTPICKDGLLWGWQGIGEP